ncbi:MAG: insulinase family protein [Sedimentisphaerales bacterium]|nr:insulinase family protein [Sedimentisphaerales bacterium]
MEFQKHQLTNGLTLVGEIHPSAQSAAVGFFVRTGARDETAQISGVSHFLEHMLFKGTDKLSALEVNEAFDSTGAKFNAFTSEENTVYYATVLPEYLDKVTDLWTQLMRPALRDDDFNMEKNVILEEIAMYKDLPQFDVMDQCRSLHFAEHPCGHSVLGSKESITALTAEQMRDYFTCRYAPNNLVLACCGNFDFDHFCKLAKDKCDSWTPSEVGRELSFFPGSKNRQHEIKANLVREHICLVSPGVAAQDPRRFAASLLGLILGDSTGSRFFWALVDTALAETAAMQYESMDGVGAFYSYIQCGRENVTRVMEIVDNIFDDVIQNGITQEELDAARNKVLSSVTIKSEQPMGRLVDLGFNWVYLKEYRSVADDVKAIKAVTADEVNGLLDEFKPSEYTLFSLGPEGQT